MNSDEVEQENKFEHDPKFLEEPCLVRARGAVLRLCLRFCAAMVS